MQYTIYVGLALCMACLAASVVAHFAFERRWQRRVEHEAESLMARARYKEPLRPDSISPQQWSEARQRIGEMQIVAEETDRPLPYKNVA